MTGFSDFIEDMGIGGSGTEWGKFTWKKGGR